MSKLALSIAVGDYDRVRPLVDGSVQIDGVDPVFMLLEPEEIFFRAFRHADFDICELSMSSFTVKTANGDCPYVGVPVFPSRAFRHNSIYIRTDRGIARPEDLKGRRIGVPEYQVTANVWTRAVLEDEHGVKPSDVTWVRGGYEQAGRIEKIAVNLPPDVHVEDAPAGATISGMLADGEIDAVIGPRAPSCFIDGHPQVGWLYPDPAAAAAAWFRKSRHIPDHAHPRHPPHPGGAASLAAGRRDEGVRAGEGARAGEAGRRRRVEGDAAVHRRAVACRARDLMGEDFWSYGLEANRHVLEVIPAAASRRGPVVAAAVAGGVVPSVDARNASRLTPTWTSRCPSNTSPNASASAKQAITAVEDMSFDVAEGEFVSLIGPSGCGKSTLFHIIGGLTGGYAGRVAVAGETITGPHPAIGMVFQEESTFPWRSVIDNVAFALELRGMPRAERAGARAALRGVGRSAGVRATTIRRNCRAGMRQRVSIARTLAAQPRSC